MSYLVIKNEKDDEEQYKNSPHSSKEEEEELPVITKLPVSPYRLIEEELWDDPWKLLISCILLNKTAGNQVRQVIWDFFKCCPNAMITLNTNVTIIKNIIYPLGLSNKRSLSIQQFSYEYLNKDVIKKDAI